MNLRLIGVRKIWSAAPHNAFTSLARHENDWYCAFREATTHMSEDGAIQVIRSRDGAVWESAALFHAQEAELPDLRDPKLLALASGELLLMGAATTRKAGVPRCNYLWRLSADGRWSEAMPTGVSDVWLWSLAREGETLYSAAYSSHTEDEPARVTLYRNRGAGFESLALLHSDAQFPNETTLLMSAGEGTALIRRELAPGQKPPAYNNGTALLATARAPYTGWEVSDLGVYIGGPLLARLPNGRLIVGGRMVRSPQHYTALWEVDRASRAVRELLILPSGGDCAYPGLCWHEGRLWVSYYSAHERQARIYLAEVEVLEE